MFARSQNIQFNGPLGRKLGSLLPATVTVSSFFLNVFFCLNTYPVCTSTDPTDLRPYCCRPHIWFCFLAVLAVGLPNMFTCGKGGRGVSADLNTTSHATSTKTVAKPSALQKASPGAGVRTSQSVPTDGILGTKHGRNMTSENNSQLTTSRSTLLGLARPNPTADSVLEGGENNLIRAVFAADHQNVVMPLSSSDTEMSVTSEDNTDQTGFHFFNLPAEREFTGGFSEESETEKEISVCNFTLGDLGDLYLGPSWSCRHRCGEHQTTDGATRPGTCQCDHMCLVYSACCEDFQQQCPTELGKAREELRKFEGNSALCQFELSFKTISFCPLSYPDNLQKKKCEQPQIISSFHQLFELSFPITDSLSGHHFRNKACWACWRGREIELGEPLPWEVFVDLPTDLEESFQHDPQIFLSYLWDNPDKCMWRPPAGYVSFYCQPSLQTCSGCAGVNALEEKCAVSSEAFLQVDGKLYLNKYCFFCSESFVSLWNEFGNSSLTQIEYQTPNISIVKLPGYNMFEFTVIFSLRNRDMHLTVLDREDFGISYSWKSLECDEVQFRCDATSCMNTLQPQHGRCDDNLMVNRSSSHSNVSTRFFFFFLIFSVYSHSSSFVENLRFHLKKKKEKKPNQNHFT